MSGERDVAIERRDLQPCRLCGRGVAHAGLDRNFFRVTIERFAIDEAAVHRRAGLEGVFGGGVAGARLAEAMGPGGALARRRGDPSSALVCDPCATALENSIADLARRLAPDAARRGG